MCKNSTNNSKKQGNNKSKGGKKSHYGHKSSSKTPTVDSRDTTVPVTKPPKTGK